MIVTNSRYLEYAYILLFSFFEKHTIEQVDIYLPYENLTENELSELSGFVNKYEGKKLIPMYVGEEFKSRVQSRNGIGVETYYRILAIDMLPKDIDRILYLDVDMVVRGNLNELYSIDLAGYAFAVCEDIFGKINGFHEANKRRLSIPEEYSYFNAGVMLYNLEYLRSDNAASKLLEAIYRDYERYEYNDQDVINELYYDKLLYVPWHLYNLPPAYYYINRFDFSEAENLSQLKYLSYDELRAMKDSDTEFSESENVMDALYRRANIIHYLGDTKPWSCTRKDAAPFHVFDWAYRNTCDRFNGRVSSDDKIRMVFFPYKIQMWDSLESIYLAAISDERCEVEVVPIPYRIHNKESNEWEEVYEGEAFSGLVPVTDYRGVFDDIIDIAFIHNPFDELNNVTRVHEEFYSYNLRKNVRTLIYVPYYVTSGFMGENYVRLSSNIYIDLHVAQCEKYVEGFQDWSAEKKVCVLGSPKLDRVIRYARQGASFPEKWRIEKTEKKKVFLNTSINAFLNDGPFMLEKLRRVFETVNERDDIILVWRPHPLLEKTLTAMKPELTELYQEIKDYFFKNEIGIFDETDDISRVVALCDAYIGEDATSVINLFAVLGKPIFIINNYLRKKYEPTDRAWLVDVKKSPEGGYHALTCVGGLQSFDHGRLSGDLIDENEPVWSIPYRSMEFYNGDIYFSPFTSREPAAYDHDTDTVVGLWGEKAEDPLFYFGSCIYDDTIFYIPSSKKMMCVMSLKSPELYFETAPFTAWKNHTKDKKMAVSGYAVIDNYLFMAAWDSNIVLRYDMRERTAALFPVGDEKLGFSAIAADENSIYLAEVKTGSIIKWSTDCGVEKVYKMPEDFVIHQRFNGLIYAHAKLAVAGDHLITAPGFSNKSICINRRTDEVCDFIPDFWKDAVTSNEYFDPLVNHTSCYLGLYDEDHVIIQRTCDAKAAIVNLSDMSYEEIDVYYDRDILNKYSESDGFEKINSDSLYTKRESVYHTLDEFFDDLINNKLEAQKDKQLSEIGSMAVNTDGSAGEHIYKYSLELFEKLTRG